MDFVILDSLGADGLKSSQADVQGDFGGIDSALANAVENFGSEVKSGGGGGDGAWRAGVDSLVALAVVRRISPRNVRRERNVSDAIEDRKEIVDRIEADMALAVFAAVKNLGLEFVAVSEVKALTDSDFASGANQALPVVGMTGKLASKEDLDASAEKIAGGGILRADGLGMRTFASAIEASGQDPSVVEDNQVAGLKQRGEVAEEAVGKLAAFPLQMQHAGLITGG
jgi:hypothetical protein